MTDLTIGSEVACDLDRSSFGRVEKKPICSEFRKENERRGVIRICINSSLEEFCYRGEKNKWSGRE